MKIRGGEIMKITLKALRVNAGYTIETASRELGISTVTLRSYETKKTIPNMEMLSKMLELYNAKFSKFEYSAKDNALILN
jgi:transcriptional regulator with XRE-family HTH domain